MQVQCLLAHVSNSNLVVKNETSNLNGSTCSSLITCFFPCLRQCKTREWGLKIEGSRTNVSVSLRSEQRLRSSATYNICEISIVMITRGLQFQVPETIPSRDPVSRWSFMQSAMSLHGILCLAFKSSSAGLSSAQKLLLKHCSTRRTNIWGRRNFSLEAQPTAPMLRNWWLPSMQGASPQNGS